MGILTLEPHPRLAAPDSPPGLVSPSSSSYSSRPSPPAEKLWNAKFGPVSPPMSNYEQSPAADMANKSMAELPNRRDSSQSGPRLSLPPLSSILGPAAGPLHSPLSDRPTGYPATSPLDRPRLPPSHGDRPYGGSYFPPQSSPAISQPRSTYDNRYDHDRQALRGLSQSISGPGSPRYRETEHMRQDSRSDVGLGGRWSIHHETGRHEYSLVSREASQPQLPGPYDRPSYQYPPSKDSGSSYRDQRPSSGSGPMQSQPLTSATNSDGIPSKDGLGPKIWTGTHFLPRFVRAAEVPGEGLCFFYDDGSHCKTIIDGEQVNAHWGVTKAGKPRKRLAIACVTCREKKIKCDPDFPRCVQCEKFGRVCKFKNAPRGGHNTSPSTAAAEPEDVRRMGGPASEMHRPGSNSSASVSPRTTLRQPSPEPPMSHKRMRLDFDSYPSMASEPPSLNRTPEAPRASLSWQHRQPYELPPIQDHLLNRAWQSDPYVSDPESISTLISSFFVHTDSTMALRFLPETAFKSWVTGNAYIKSPGDLMLIYSILAVGVALSGGPKNIANEYAQIAHYAQHRAACNLQLTQARLLLALYYLSLSRLNDANELISGAISTSIDLQLNLELEKSIEADLTDFPYGLQRDGYSESRRRTYWACFVLERLSGVFPNRLSILNVKDIFIRLPCENELFERQAKSDASFFPAAMAMSSKAVIRPLGILAYLVQLVAIWGEAMSELYRAAQSQEIDYDAAGFIDTVMEKLIGWRESLPECFTYSSGNMALAAQDGTLSTFLTIHLVYLHGLMKIHRHVRTESIAASVRLQYETRIHEEATRVLDITGMLEVLLQGRRAPISAPPPFMSYVILEATDILTAEGPLADVSLLLDRLAVARAIVDAAGMVWEEARAHQSAMEQRLDALRALRDRQPSDAPLAGSRVFDHEESKDSKLPAGRCWQMDDPMGTTFPRRMDLVYIRS